MKIGEPSALRITVYVPEDRYGEIRLGDPVQVTVDSFEGKTFAAHVVRIADEAEFTPRNVQTEEGRRTTVFAVEVAVEDPQGLLKPGNAGRCRLRGIPAVSPSPGGRGTGGPGNRCGVGPSCAGDERI